MRIICSSWIVTGFQIGPYKSSFQTVIPVYLFLSPGNTSTWQEDFSKSHSEGHVWLDKPHMSFTFFFFFVPLLLIIVPMCLAFIASDSLNPDALNPSQTASGHLFSTFLPSVSRSWSLYFELVGRFLVIFGSHQMDFRVSFILCLKSQSSDVHRSFDVSWNMVAV